MKGGGGRTKSAFGRFVFSSFSSDFPPLFPLFVSFHSAVLTNNELGLTTEEGVFDCLPMDCGTPEEVRLRKSAALGRHCRPRLLFFFTKAVLTLDEMEGTNEENGFVTSTLLIER